MYYKSILFSVVTLLTGCSVAVTTPVENINALRYSATTKFENIKFEGKYYELSMCWDSNVEKRNVNFRNSTFLEHHPDQKKSVAYVGWTAASYTTKMYYAILMEFTEHSETETIVNAYGVGARGAQEIPLWLGVIKDCEFKLQHKD